MNKKLYENKSECCGCEACVNICPVNIIEMHEDEEGFLYPFIIDESKCIECNQCEKVCPIKNSTVNENFKEISYAGFSNSVDEIKTSASGGIAYQISHDFITQGGIVYGVEYNNNCMNICYNRAEKIEQLYKFKTSKYVQARKYDIYKKIKMDLEKNDKKVLFIGLPCDCYALKLYIKKEVENLYICSLICHGISSPKVHKEYCKNLIDKKNSLIKKFSVRYKKEGWKPYYIYAQFENKEVYTERFDKSVYGKAFLYLKRPSCNNCTIKRNKIFSDITLGDYHLASGGKEKPYNQWGVSSVIAHTEKGNLIIKRNKNINIEEVPIKKILYSEAYEKAIPAKINRKSFGKMFAKNGIFKACELFSVKLIDKFNEVKNNVLGNISYIKKYLLKKR